MLWTVRVMGWMAVLDASGKRSALRDAKSLASSASLLPSDVGPGNISLATDEDVAWYQSMGGAS